MHEPSEEFAKCWAAAGNYIERYAQGAQVYWLKQTLNPPFLEHLSFRMGNQLFFIRLVDVDEVLKTPGSSQGLMTISKGCKGHAAMIPMKKTSVGWTPDEPGWGLVDSYTGHRIDPAELVSDVRIEMTDWEIQDFAVQVVRDYICDKLKFKLMSWQGNPDVDPSIWFVGDDGPEWVAVRAARYPEEDPLLPKNISKIAKNCLQLSNAGNFASVSLANSEDDHFDFTNSKLAAPLWRGYGIHVKFSGLVKYVLT